MIFGIGKKQPQPLRRPQHSTDDISFRRSRTLTGSASSDVSSVVESRTQLKSPRLKEHELKKHRNLLLGGLMGVVCLIGAGLWLLDQYVVDVSLATNASRQIDTAQYQRSINDYLNSHPLERFRFSMDQQKLAAYVQQNHSEVASLSITGAPGLVSSNGQVILRKPVAVWQVGNDKNYVDNTGEVFRTNAFSEPGVSITDNSGVAVDDVQLIASARLLRFIGQVVGGINASEIGPVTQVTIPAGTLRQLDVVLQGKGYPIKTHMDREPSGQVADVVAAVRYLASKDIVPQYVDTRVSGRAFYR